MAFLCVKPTPNLFCMVASYPLCCHPSLQVEEHPMPFTYWSLPAPPWWHQWISWKRDNKRYLFELQTKEIEQTGGQDEATTLHIWTNMPPWKTCTISQCQQNMVQLTVWDTKLFLPNPFLWPIAYPFVFFHPHLPENRDKCSPVRRQDSGWWWCLISLLNDALPPQLASILVPSIVLYGTYSSHSYLLHWDTNLLLEFLWHDISAILLPELSLRGKLFGKNWLECTLYDQHRRIFCHKLCISSNTLSKIGPQVSNNIRCGLINFVEPILLT